jgi:hypothetical protein
MMEIEYLKSLKETPKIGEQEIKGVTEKYIQEVEKSLGIKFPLAYREFLLLAGDDSGNLRLFPGYSDLEMLSKETVRKRLLDMITRNDVKITRPIWPVTEMDGFEQFVFFYLDEQKEDPEIWVAYYNDEKSRIVQMNRTFSQYIDDVVKDSVLYEERGY